MVFSGVVREATQAVLFFYSVGLFFKLYICGPGDVVVWYSSRPQRFQNAGFDILWRFVCDVD